MDKIKTLFIKHKEIIMYVIFGVLTTGVNWGAYAMLQPLLKVAMNGDRMIWTVFGMDITMNILAVFFANFLAWVAGVAFAFVTNKIWVFESKSWRFGLVMKELWLFVLARLITGVLEWVVVPLLVAMGLNGKLFGVDGFGPKLVVSVAVVILNYVFSKVIIFREKSIEKTVE